MTLFVVRMRLCFLFVVFVLLQDFGAGLSLFYVMNNVSMISTFMDQTASFGPSKYNITSFLSEMKPLTGCQDFSSNPSYKTFYRNSIVLIQRGDCTFSDKVYYAQKLGALGVIVGNYKDQNALVTMYKANDHRNIYIPAVFVKNNDFERIRSLLTYQTHQNNKIRVMLEARHSRQHPPSHSLRGPRNNGAKAFGVLTFSILMICPIICCIAGFIFFCSKLFKHRKRTNHIRSIPMVRYQGSVTQNDKESMDRVQNEEHNNINNDDKKKELKSDSIQMLSSLKKKANFFKLKKKYAKYGRLFSKQFIQESPKPHNDHCCICLDDFEISEKIKLLPCNHGFHSQCIDQWLGENSDLCPICKQSVFVKDRKHKTKNALEVNNNEQNEGNQPEQNRSIGINIELNEV